MGKVWSREEAINIADGVNNVTSEKSCNIAASLLQKVDNIQQQLSESLSYGVIVPSCNRKLVFNITHRTYMNSVENITNVQQLIDNSEDDIVNFHCCLVKPAMFDANHISGLMRDMQSKSTTFGEMNYQASNVFKAQLHKVLSEKIKPILLNNGVGAEIVINLAFVGDGVDLADKLSLSLIISCIFGE